MAVELRCPDCRAKLRLPEEPEPGSDVECPECNAVFPAPDPDTGEVPDDRGGKKKGKKGGDAKEKAAPKDKTPNMRKAKKKEPNRTALTLVIVGAVLFVSLTMGLLIWYFNRTPPSYEMMNYLPVDSTDAIGVNIGHMHRYAEFKKAVEPTYAGMGFQRAIEAMAKAFGIDADDVPDYMVQGWGKNGGALVIRTKKPFDPADLKKLPGAVEGKLDGETYYSISPMTKLFGGAPLKVFAPTKRLVVFVDYNLPQATFQPMLSGNKGGDTLNKRLGSLGKRTTRGTFWYIGVLDAGNKPKEPDKKDVESGKGALQGEQARAAAKAKGLGFKTSLGSRAVRFEVALWYEDSDIPYEVAKKYKGDSELAKAQDDSSLSPPRFWKDIAEGLIGSKKVANEMFTNLSVKSSGDLLVFSTEAETKNVMEILQSLVRKFTGETQGGIGLTPPAGPGGPGGAPPPIAGGAGVSGAK